MSNYGMEFNFGQKKEAHQEENRKTQIDDEEIEQNIVFQDEKPIYDVYEEKDIEGNQGGAHSDDKKQWTQQQDQILIDNYVQFSSLSKKDRYKMLATLVGEKTYKECYERAKQLKLKSGDVVAAKEISHELLSKQARSTKNLLVKHALDWLIKSLCKKEADSRINYKRIEQMCTYIQEIQAEYADYVNEKEELILFGHEKDMADIVNNNEKC